MHKCSLRDNHFNCKQVSDVRFGNTQQVIAAHMDDLLKLLTCSEEKTQHFCAIYEKVCVNVRGLKALGIGAEQYGNFLIPVIFVVPSWSLVQFQALGPLSSWGPGKNVAPPLVGPVIMTCHKPVALAMNGIGDTLVFTSVILF